MEVFGKFFTCQIESKVKIFSTPKHKMHDLIHTQHIFTLTSTNGECAQLDLYFSAIVAILIVLTMGCMSSFTFVIINSI